MSTTTTSAVTNCHRNIMGTLSFDGLFPSMRKAQAFIVYPMQDSSERITIQSDHRFGHIDLASGKAILSANRQQYANSIWLAQCIRARTVTVFELPEEDRQTLRQWVKSTGGVKVGSSFVKCDNTGAMAL